MSQVVFTDPRTSATYTWTHNPSADYQPASKARNIERTSNTANVGAMKQQGDDGPFILDWTINVLTTAQETALWQWYMLCKLQTIYVTDWDGEEYEGQIILLSRQRQLATAEYAVYEMQFECYAFISGVLATAGVSP